MDKSPAVIVQLTSTDLTLRDLFAGFAMAGMFASDTEDWNAGQATDSRAKQAYEMADAMLAARKAGAVEPPAEPHSPIVARGNEGRRANDF